MTNEEGVITGLGGVFVKCNDRPSLVKWYQDTLKFPYDGYGANFLFREMSNPNKVGYQVWGPFKNESDYFAPSEKSFMVNLRVRGLDALLKRLKAEGVEQIGETETYEYGKFAWILDPEGTKIELWEQIGEAPSSDGTTSGSDAT